MSGTVSPSTVAVNAGLVAVGAPTVPSGATVLTVGAGKEYSTIGAAVAAAQSGDVVLVDAGTYTNDFATVTSNITIEGVGGMVNMVATQPPPNLKGIVTVDSSCTIENVSFSGSAIPDADGGNGAGIRYEGGDLKLYNDAFSNNQNGLLGSPVLGLVSNTITVDHCLFSGNGSGTGYTHNLYVGNVNSLTATNSVFTKAVVGHEFKSRAIANTIVGNQFIDGPTGTASYNIDLPNGGTDLVQGNLIEKGPNAQNDAMVHFGGEGIPYSGSSLTVTGNAFVNDLGPQAVGVVNQTAITVAISGNSFTNIASGQIASGPATEKSNVDGQGNALPDSSQTGVLPGSTLVITDNNPHTVTLSNNLQAVEGGGGLLTVLDPIGHVVAIGGSGGMIFTESNGAGGNQITTAAGSTNTIEVGGQDLIDSQGNDTIVGGGGNLTGLVTGVATISDGSGNDQWSVSGRASIVGNGGNPVVSVASGASLNVTGPVGYLHVENNGGTAAVAVQEGSAAVSLSIVGGAVDAVTYNGTVSISTAPGPIGTTLTLGAGTVQVVSAGADTIRAGSGADTVIVSANASVYAGTGSLAVYGRGDTMGAVVYGNGGTYLLGGDTGNITYYGGALASTVNLQLARNTLVGGAGLLTVAGGCQETVTGGSGGLNWNETSSGGGNRITTASGATDHLTLGGGDVVNSYGTDTISGGTGNQLINAYGNAVISGSSGNSQLNLYGQDVLYGVGYDQVTVHSGAYAVLCAGSLLAVNEQGAVVNMVAQRGAPGQPALARAVLRGGSANGMVNADRSMTVTTGSGTTTDVRLFGGTATVSANGADLIHAESGTDTININAANVQVWGGTGSTAVNDTCGTGTPVTVYGGSGALSYQQGGAALTFIGGAGTATLNGGWGTMNVTGGAGALTISGGNGLTFAGGSGTAQITLSTNGGTIAFGSGSTTVQEQQYSKAVLYEFLAGHGGGTDVINGFIAGSDQLSLQGVSVASQTVSGGSAQIVLSDNTHLQLTGVTNLSHLFG